MVGKVDFLKLELKKLQLKAKVKKPKFYFVYFVFLISLAYIMDEICNNIHPVLQTYAQNAFLPNQNINMYVIITNVCAGISFFTFFYKALADKFGRKPFLVINTFGLIGGMILSYLATNIYIYAAGLLITSFFIPCHIQMVLIMEESNDKHRGFWLSLTKAIGTVGVAIVPFIKTFIADKDWQIVFLIPAGIGLVLSILSIFFIRETDAFIYSRIDSLRKEIKEESNPEQKKIKKLIEKENKKKKDAQGGIIPAIKYMFFDKQLLWLFLIGTLMTIASLGIGYYPIIMNPAKDVGLTNDEYETATTLFPFVWALIEVLVGFVSDKFGRKRASVAASSFAFVGFLWFVLSIKIGTGPYLVGIFLGIFFGGYYSCQDTINIICGEKSPTNLRSSLLSVISISFSVGSFIGTGLLLLFNTIIPNLDTGLFTFILLLPALLGAVLVLIFKIPETKEIPLFTKVHIYFKTRIDARKQVKNKKDKKEEDE